MGVVGNCQCHKFTPAFLRQKILSQTFTMPLVTKSAMANALLQFAIDLGHLIKSRVSMMPLGDDRSEVFAIIDDVVAEAGGIKRGLAQGNVYWGDVVRLGNSISNWLEFGLAKSSLWTTPLCRTGGSKNCTSC